MDARTEQPRSWEAITQALERELLHEFRDFHSPALIRQTAVESVREFTEQDVRIKAFVPVLASSLARRRLRHLVKRAG